MMRAATVLLLHITPLLSGAAFAQESDEYQLKIKPQFCVIDSDEQVCHAPLLAQWQHPETQTQNLCLYQAHNPQALHCDAAQSGQQQFRWQASLSSDEHIALKNADSDTVAQTTIVVAHLVTDLRPRRRYGWSIF